MAELNYRIGAFAAPRICEADRTHWTERQRLETALAGLRPDYREVIILARIREPPIKEIARTTGRTPEAVSMLLLRALRQLKKYFGNTDSFTLPAWSLDETYKPSMADAEVEAKVAVWHTAVAKA